MNKYNFLLILAGLCFFQVKAQEAVSDDLEEVNVSESLKKSESAPVTNAAADVKMSTLEEQDDLQSLKEDIGDVVFDKDKKAAPLKTAEKEEIKTENFSGISNY